MILPIKMNKQKDLYLLWRSPVPVFKHKRAELIDLQPTHSTHFHFSANTARAVGNKTKPLKCLAGKMLWCFWSKAPWHCFYIFFLIKWYRCHFLGAILEWCDLHKLSFRKWFKTATRKRAIRDYRPSPGLVLLCCVVFVQFCVVYFVWCLCTGVLRH